MRYLTSPAMKTIDLPSRETIQRYTVSIAPPCTNYESEITKKCMDARRLEYLRAGLTADGKKRKKPLSDRVRNMSLEEYREHCKNHRRCALLAIHL